MEGFKRGMAIQNMIKIPLNDEGRVYKETRPKKWNVGKKSKKGRKYN